MLRNMKTNDSRVYLKIVRIMDIDKLCRVENGDIRLVSEQLGIIVNGISNNQVVGYSVDIEGRLDRLLTEEVGLVEILVYQASNMQLIGTAYVGVADLVEFVNTSISQQFYEVYIENNSE